MEDHFSRNDLKILVDLYEMHPGLYDVNSPQYQNRNTRNRLWDDFTAQFNQKVNKNYSANAIRKKINGLRTQFKDIQNRIKKSMTRGSSSVYTPSWYLYERLQFIKNSPTKEAHDSLVPVIQRTVGDFQESDESQNLPRGKEEIEFEENTVDQELLFDSAVEDIQQTFDVQTKDNVSHSTRLQSPKKLKKDNEESEVMLLLDKATAFNCKSKQNDNDLNSIEDSMFLFFRYIYSEARNLKTEDSKEYLKTEVFKALLAAKQKDK